jgi:hypothetical protein
MGEARWQDLEVPLPYQWRERAKPLKGRVAVAASHVGCCVLCCVVCVCVCVCSGLPVPGVV